jgi:hypothetical protein
MTADLQPRTLRPLVLRIAATLLAAVMLYVLGAGPAMYLEQRRFEKRRMLTLTWGNPFPPSIPKVYLPLFTATKGTFMDGMLMKYCMWWMDQANSAWWMEQTDSTP